MPHDVKEYPDARHRFMNRHESMLLWRLAERTASLGYAEGPAEDAKRRIVAFFTEHRVER